MLVTEAPAVSSGGSPALDTGMIDPVQRKMSVVVVWDPRQPGRACARLGRPGRHGDRAEPILRAVGIPACGPDVRCGPAPAVRLCLHARPEAAGRRPTALRIVSAPASHATRACVSPCCNCGRTTTASCAPRCSGQDRPRGTRCVRRLACRRGQAAPSSYGAIAGEGPFHHVLVDHLRERGSLACETSCHTRAFLRPRSDADNYLQAALSGNQRRDLKRREKRLADGGPLDYQKFGPADDIESWAESFMRLEAAGWKGREKTALASDPASRRSSSSR